MTWTWYSHHPSPWQECWGQLGKVFWVRLLLGPCCTRVEGTEHDQVSEHHHQTKLPSEPKQRRWTQPINTSNIMRDRQGHVDESPQKVGWGTKILSNSLARYEEARNFYLTCRGWCGGWRAKSEVKSTDCYCRGPRFDAPTWKLIKVS